MVASSEEEDEEEEEEDREEPMKEEVAEDKVEKKDGLAWKEGRKAWMERTRRMLGRSVGSKARFTTKNCMDSTAMRTVLGGASIVQVA